MPNLQANSILPTHHGPFLREGCGHQEWITAPKESLLPPTMTTQDLSTELHQAWHLKKCSQQLPGDNYTPVLQIRKLQLKPHRVLLTFSRPRTPNASHSIPGNPQLASSLVPYSPSAPFPGISSTPPSLGILSLAHIHASTMLLSQIPQAPLMPWYLLGTARPHCPTTSYIAPQQGQKSQLGVP